MLASFKNLSLLLGFPVSHKMFALSDALRGKRTIIVKRFGSNTDHFNPNNKRYGYNHPLHRLSGIGISDKHKICGVFYCPNSCMDFHQIFRACYVSWSVLVPWQCFNFFFFFFFLGGGGLLRFVSVLHTYTMFHVRNE